MITYRLLDWSARELAVTVISLCIVFSCKHSLPYCALRCQDWTSVNQASALPAGSALAPARPVVVLERNGRLRRKKGFAPPTCFRFLCTLSRWSFFPGQPLFPLAAAVECRSQFFPPSAELTSSCPTWRDSSTSRAQPLPQRPEVQLSRAPLLSFSKY